MRSSAGVTKHLSCSIAPSWIQLSSISTPPSTYAWRRNSNAQSSRRKEQNEFNLSWEQICFLPCWWHEWLKMNIQGHIRNWSTVVKQRKKAFFFMSLWEFSTKVSNSLNSNQAQDTSISIWVVHQRAKRKEIWARAGSGLKAFKWFLSVRKLFPLSVHAQKNCFSGTSFPLSWGHSSFDQLIKSEVWKYLLSLTHTHSLSYKYMGLAHLCWNTIWLRYLTWADLNEG